MLGWPAHLAYLIEPCSETHMRFLNSVQELF
jgi:hypothetical protein